MVMGVEGRSGYGIILRRSFEVGLVGVWLRGQGWCGGRVGVGV